MSQILEAVAPGYIEKLEIELFRVCSQKGFYNTFTDEKGATIQGATETAVKAHLTSNHRDTHRADGREWRFPGLANGWQFSPAIEAAGFRIVRAKNYRGQWCRVVTI